MDSNVSEAADAILQNIARHVNCLNEENRNTKKRAIEGIKKELLGKKPAIDEATLQDVFSVLIKPLLKLVSDPVEKCRELSTTVISECIVRVSKPEEFLSYIIPVLVQRLGQQEITEPSEELRLILVGLLLKLVELSDKRLAAYLDDLVRILQRTLVDPYPEVKKCSCKCTQMVAKKTKGPFHMSSESFIQPLLQGIAHQHSRVRVDIVYAIGDVLQYGNGKNVDDVVSHFAQRLFDQAPSVRIGVITVVGNWLLNLMDRYSFFPKLMPLLLTGLTDELPEIQKLAESLWHDVGLKYEGENPDDLKDKQDFVKPDPSHYPLGVERPNLGCRELMYRNFSRILNGLSRDITDWVVETRIKSAQLLYTMLINEEDNVTQHLEKVLAALYKACIDDEKEVVTYVVKSAELVGFFVKPEVWCKMVLQNVKLTQSYSSLMVLAAVLKGSERYQLKPYLQDITSVLTDPLVCRVADASLQTQLSACVESLLTVMKEDVAVISQELFDILITVIALHRTDDILEKSQKLMEELASCQQLNNSQALYEKHTKPLIDSLKEDYMMWTQHSTERFIFDAVILNSGPVVGEILEDVIPLMVANLNPDKDPEVRLKFFTLLSKLMLNAPATIDSQNRFGEFCITVIRDMVLPNLVWKAGRTAVAIRTTAVSCLWALLQSGLLTREKLCEVAEEMLTQLLSSLEDDSKQTRIITCRVLKHMFITAGPSLDQDRLHNIYPELLKRLDDSSDDIRVAVSQTFVAYFDCFQEKYEVVHYRAHLEQIYKGLLVHLDDPEATIQESVLDVLIHCAKLDPSTLLKEIDAVRLKHRTTTYLDRLLKHIHSLPKVG